MHTLVELCSCVGSRVIRSIQAELFTSFYYRPLYCCYVMLKLSQYWQVYTHESGNVYHLIIRKNSVC